MLKARYLPRPTWSEFEVQTGFDDVDSRFDGDWKCRHEKAAGRTNEVVRAVTKVVVIVFDEASEPVHESVFSAHASSPAFAGLTHCGSGNAGDQEIKIGLQPSTAALHIDKEAIPSRSGS